MDRRDVVSTVDSGPRIHLRSIGYETVYPKYTFVEPYRRYPGMLDKGPYARDCCGYRLQVSISIRHVYISIGITASL